MSYPKWSLVSRDPAILMEALRAAADVIRRGDKALPARVWFTRSQLAAWLAETATSRVIEESPEKTTDGKAQSSRHPAETLIRGIDWSLLRSQKQFLIDNASWKDWVEGLLVLIDAIQDCAVDKLGLAESVVFPPTGKN